MKLNYNDILRRKLYILQDDLGLSHFTFDVCAEQEFIKPSEMDPNTIYVLTKNLTSDNSIGVVTQPVQILILSENDSLDVARLIFSEFAKRYNFEAISEVDGTTSIWVKQQYSDPVVLSNFNTVNYGYRSVLYISATLYIMENVIDVKNLEIDDEDIEALNFNISYSMSTNTQQLAEQFIANSVKTVSTFAISMSVPMLNTAFVRKVLNILNETDDTNNTNLDVSERIPYNGNNNFEFSFDFRIGDAEDAYSLTIEKDMKLVSAQVITAPNQVPSLQLGFMK